MTTGTEIRFNMKAAEKIDWAEVRREFAKRQLMYYDIKENVEIFAELYVETLYKYGVVDQPFVMVFTDDDELNVFLEREGAKVVPVFNK